MPLCAYHLEHEKDRAGPSRRGAAEEADCRERHRMALRRSDRPHLDHMQWLRRPMIFNGAGWGMGDALLPETTCQPVADNA